MAEPGSDDSRYRCRACGNLTRFDVVSTVRSQSFHHYSVGGELTVSDVVVLDSRIESVTCRWCGGAGNVEPVISRGDGQVTP
jgi:hypothetical protein